MRDLSLHVLDLLDNCLAAAATWASVEVREDTDRDLVEIEVQDNGVGMDAVSLARARDPFFTTRPGKRTGMGLPLFAQAAREAGGEVAIESEPGGGTRVRASFRLGHPDRKPLGDMEGTIEAVRAAHPEMELAYRHTVVARAVRQGGSV